jgi:predicted alpha/beta hydrolase
MNFEKILSVKKKIIRATVFSELNAATVVIIASATGVKQTFYQNFAEHLSQNGITVITFDYYGIGQSLGEPIKNIDTDVYDWGADNLEAVINFAKESFPGLKICLLGHSISGQLIGLAKSSLLADKIILVAAQTGHWKFWKGFSKYKMWANWHIVFPALTFLFGYFPAKIISRMENLPKAVALQWRKWCVSPNYLFDCIEASKIHYSKITTDILSLSIEDDTLAPKESVDWLTAKYSNARVERTHLLLNETGLKRIGHFGIFNLKAKDTVWQTMVDKIKQ